MEKIVKIFKKVQKIPYKIIPFNEKEIDKNLKYGDCRHKSFLLKKLLDKEGYNSKIIFVLFDWKDLPIPNEMISILKKSGTIFGHKILKIRVGNKEIKIDCSWDPKLKKGNFPVTEKWNGLEDTKQITEKKIQFLSKEEFNKKKPSIDKKEAHLFAESLNKFLKKIRKN